MNLRSKFGMLITIGFVTFLGVLLWQINKHSAKQENPAQPTVLSAKSDRNVAPRPADHSSVPPENFADYMDRALNGMTLGNFLLTLPAYERILWVEQALKLGSVDNADESRMLTKALKESLLSSKDVEQNVESIMQYLLAGSDADTGLDFVVTENHVLDSCPTLRVDMLDALGQLSPPHAAGMATQIFSEKRSPEEWVLGMRNYLWDSQNYTRDQFDSYFQELLNTDEWNKQPTAGFLHGFDAAVLLADERNIGTMAALVNAPDTNFASRYAASLALDKLMQTDSSAIYAYAPSHTPGTNAEDSNFKGGLLARTDPSDPAQMIALEVLLAKSTPGSGEFETFSQLFPNGIGHDSGNLFSRSQPTDLHDLATADAAALSVVERWSKQNRFPEWKSEIAAMKQRLSNYVDEAKQAGLLP